MSSKPSWRHHFVPQFYLREFTSDRLVYGLSTASGKTFRAKTVDIAFKKHFHTLKGEPVPDLHEREMAVRIEGPLSNSHRQMLAAMRFNPAFPGDAVLRRRLDWLVAYQMVRLPRQRERLEKVIPNFMKVGQIYSPVDELARIFHLRILGSGDHQNLRETVMGQIADSMGAFSVSFLRTAITQPFWTSDAPVIIGHQAREGSRFRLDCKFGLAPQEAQVFFPLAPDLMACFHKGTLPLLPLSVQGVKPEQRDLLNKFTYFNAATQVYSSRPVHLPEEWQAEQSPRQPDGETR